MPGDKRETDSSVWEIWKTCASFNNSNSIGKRSGEHAVDGRESMVAPLAADLPISVKYGAYFRADFVIILSEVICRC